MKKGLPPRIAAEHQVRISVHGAEGFGLSLRWAVTTGSGPGSPHPPGPSPGSTAAPPRCTPTAPPLSEIRVDGRLPDVSCCHEVGKGFELAVSRFELVPRLSLPSTAPPSHPKERGYRSDSRRNMISDHGQTCASLVEYFLFSSPRKYISPDSSLVVQTLAQLKTFFSENSFLSHLSHFFALLHLLFAYILHFNRKSTV